MAVTGGGTGVGNGKTINPTGKPEGMSDIDWVVKIVGGTKTGTMLFSTVVKKAKLGTAGGDKAIKDAGAAGKLELKDGGVVKLVLG